MMEKRRAIEDKIMEETLYAELWKQDMRVKEAKEKWDQEMKERMKKDTIQVLDWQKQQNEVKKGAEVELTEVEKQMLNTQWNIEQEKEGELRKQALLLNKERNLEIIWQNILEKQIIEAGQRQEKDWDRDMVQQAVERERAIEFKEAEERE